LAPGEMSLHHGRLVHGSRPNRSQDRRIGFNVQYITPAVHQVVGKWDSATLVAGEDRLGHFAVEPSPGADYDPWCVACREQATVQRAAYIYAGAAAGRR